MSTVSATMSSYRVLIVDDNEGIHEDFRTLLQPRRDHDELDTLAQDLFGDEAANAEVELGLPHYRFDSAYQGRSALENVATAVADGDTYALAFVDIRMPPGWDGVETIRQLWEIDPDIQMVLCSAYSDYSWEEIVQTLGASNKLLMLRKPFDPSAVKQLTLAATSRWYQDRLHRARIHELEEQIEEYREQRSSGAAQELVP